MAKRIVPNRQEVRLLILFHSTQRQTLKFILEYVTGGYHQGGGNPGRPPPNNPPMPPQNHGAGGPRNRKERF